MRHRLVTLAALLLTAALLYFVPETEEGEKRSGVETAVLWVNEKEKAVDRWLKKCAAAYEKETGCRVYLRAATEEESKAALGGTEGVVPPDLLVSPESGETVCLRGYALIVRDETAARTTPAPTGALFIRPSPEPRQTSEPETVFDPALLIGALASEELLPLFPEAALSRDPAGEFAAGNGKAAILTAGQAAGLAVGCRACALPEGRGFLPVRASSLTAEGQEFLSFLLRPDIQRTLSDFGLYTQNPGLILYGGADPLRGLIESSRPSENENGE